MVNTLWDGFVEGYGGDVDALRDPDRVWGRLIADGVTMIQTDEPEALLRFIARQGGGEDKQSADCRQQSAGGEGA